jgi:hypothetical protein
VEKPETSAGVGGGEDATADPAAATGLTRYGAGDVCGEVPLLLPGSVHFCLKVEVRAASSLVHAYGLQRLDYATLAAQFPHLTALLAGLLGAAFEANFGSWVTVTAPKDFDYEDMVDEAQVRSGVRRGLLPHLPPHDAARPVAPPPARPPPPPASNGASFAAPRSSPGPAAAAKEQPRAVSADALPVGPTNGSLQAASEEAGGGGSAGRKRPPKTKATQAAGAAGAGVAAIETKARTAKGLGKSKETL